MKSIIENRGFVDRLRAFGDEIALNFDNGLVLTYRGLANRVDEFAKSIGSERCLIMLEATLSVESIIAYLAALKIRNPIILTSADQKEANDEIARIFDVNIVIKEDGTIITINENKQNNALYPDLAVLLSTSGSTGSAKLVRLSYENIESNAKSISTYLQLAPDDIGALTLPLHYSYGLSVLNSHLFIGAGLCISEIPVINPDILDWFESAGCTNISGVPYSYEIFERIGLRNHRLTSLRFMTAAGGRLPPDIIHTYADYFMKRGGRFFVMYGQTEATARISYVPPDKVYDHADCIGIAIPDGQLSLLDEGGNQIETKYTSGELVYRGPNIMMGYATSAVDLAKGAELDELHTGDLGEQIDNGFFRIIGRKSRFSKLSGFRVSHDDIERRLKNVEISAIVTGNDTFLAVAVIDETNVDEVSRHIMEFSNVKPAQMKVFSLKDVPRLSSGKIDYQSINKLAATIHHDDQNDELDPILKSFTKAFWPRPVKASDSFVSLGGDSLAFVELVIALEKIIGRLPVDWEKMPISEIAAKPLVANRWPQVDPNVYIRALAIFLIVIHHVSRWGATGGAYVLMIMVGYNLGRFQSQALFNGSLRDVGRQLGKNLFLYYLALLPWLIYEGSFRWPELLLISNFITTSSFQDAVLYQEPILYNSYWFVESYAHIVAIMILLCVFPAVRTRISKFPLGYGVAALILSIVLIFAGRELWTLSWSSCYQRVCLPTSEIAYFAAIGWCLYFADTLRWKIAISIIAIACFVGVSYIFYSVISDRLWFLVLAVFLLLARVKIVLPPLLSRIMKYLAANSYIIYLFHMVPFFFMQKYGFSIGYDIVSYKLFNIALGFIFPLLIVFALNKIKYLYRG